MILFSGGLDSQIAVKLMEKADADVVLLHLYTKLSLLEKAVDEVNYKSRITSLAGKDPVHFLDFSDDFLKIVLNPHFGYGSGVNPCLDCRLLMLKKAASALSPPADFIVTGEVLGQRPMSQNKGALNLLERKSGLEGLILRPLSAKLLNETIPERKGWVRRESLLAIQGRSRKEQLQLAEKFSIAGYLQPGGGCILTDKNYARRLGDLLAHSNAKDIKMRDLLLLKIGRHLRLNEHLKIVIGRDKEENALLGGLADGLRRFRIMGCGSPVTAACCLAPLSAEELELIGEITACYSGGADEAFVQVQCCKDEKIDEFTVKPLARDELLKKGWLI